MNAAINFSHQNQSQSNQAIPQPSVQGRCQGAEISLSLASDSLDMLCELCELAEKADHPVYSASGMAIVINHIQVQIQQARDALKPLHGQTASRACA